MEKSRNTCPESTMRSKNRRRSTERSRSCEKNRKHHKRSKRSPSSSRSSSRSSYERRRRSKKSKRSRSPSSDTSRRSDRRSRNSSSNSIGSDRRWSKKSKSKKSRRRRSHSSSSQSSKSSMKSRKRSRRSRSSSTELLRRLEEDRQVLKEKRRQEKRDLKATETLEEKRNRRLLKKELKALRQKEKMGWDEEYAHYTNDDNPFGDSNLMQTFRWNKKLEKEGLDKLEERDLQRIQRQKMEEQRMELEKVKMRRLIREKEREERQQLIEMEERGRENEKFSKWQQEEDEFHLQQARLRSSIRIQDGRAKPIDLLAKYISAEDEVDAIEMHEPYTYLNGLTIGDLEDLLADINVYKEIDLAKNQDFWDDIVVIVGDELGKMRKLDAKSQYELAAERRQGIHKVVASDVQKIFEGKTATQLYQLKENIELKLSSKTEGIDVNYWESLLSQLKAHLARARLRDKHQENLKKKLQVLKAEQQSTTLNSEKAEGPVSSDKDETKEDCSHYEPQPGSSHEAVDPAVSLYHSRNYSPLYLQQDDLELGTFVSTEQEDESKRNMDQSKILTGGKVDSVMNAEEKALEREAKKGMAGDEASFAVETALEQSYEWSDKYRPRKPRYFNRVHTGFEWNKYNQTHYDVDNPPPKIVQGYKFNIFYPDLINKKATPEYTLTPCQDNSDFCVLRIHAGPPYEDIAFKIVNREWEYGYKRGFKCQFHNNIFQLWFHFKRLRYRR